MLCMEVMSLFWRTEQMLSLLKCLAFAVHSLEEIRYSMGRGFR